MIWHDNARYCRSVSDQGYLLTWTYSVGGSRYRAWAKREKDERRGRLLGSWNMRSDAERACVEHYARNGVMRPTVGHLFVCSKCGAMHSRFNDRAKTCQSAYCLPCRSANRKKSARRRHSELSPEEKKKGIARSYANVYQRRGKLVPMPCEKCGAINVQKHHEDYNKPLEVRWLCRPCHLAEHAQEASFIAHTEARA